MAFSVNQSTLPDNGGTLLIVTTTGTFNLAAPYRVDIDEILCLGIVPGGFPGPSFVGDPNWVNPINSTQLRVWTPLLVPGGPYDLGVTTPSTGRTTEASLITVIKPTFTDVLFGIRGLAGRPRYTGPQHLADVPI